MGSIESRLQSLEGRFPSDEEASFLEEALSETVRRCPDEVLDIVYGALEQLLYARGGEDSDGLVDLTSVRDYLDPADRWAADEYMSILETVYQEWGYFEEY
jgi:hypothetical protein